MNMQLPNGDLDRLRYVNITMIDAKGGATQGQIATTDFAEALRVLTTRVTDAAERALRNTWDSPIVAAYLYDNATHVLHTYAIKPGDLHTAPTVVEVVQ